jgi:hypothetical protein
MVFVVVIVKSPNKKTGRVLKKMSGAADLSFFSGFLSFFLADRCPQQPASSALLPLPSSPFRMEGKSHHPLLKAK